ncbi:MAG: hypothetical protein ACW99U_16530 [Candidatus Thorarchaeota archaeon]|jgi:hypothetical protein
MINRPALRNDFVQGVFAWNEDLMRLEDEQVWDAVMITWDAYNEVELVDEDLRWQIEEATYIQDWKLLYPEVMFYISY